ncbi:putative ABC transporter permease [Bacillus sp. EB01]|uniref:putative ABC transporter permease n=1 Tax=Bacillus sp. EB01 TaxID=1347086 RepID=UPI000693AFA0|nr:putative ABC transporter permease [Bacillus sp. EB01]
MISIPLEATDVGTISALVFYFTVYSFFGWILENAYSRFTGGEFFKPNLFKGPFKPMYGFAPVLLLLLIDEQTTWPVIILLCLIIPTMIEYVSGIMLEKLFNRRYWDYSNVPFQLHGHICLPFSLCWVALSVAGLKWLHPEIASLYEAISPFWKMVYPGIILLFLMELVLAVRRRDAVLIELVNE